MGYEATLGALPAPAAEMAAPAAEVVSPYAEIGHDDLIGMFYDADGDPAIGRALSVRLFEHAAIPVDPAREPLIGRDGKQVVHQGKPLTLEDYVNYAAEHHFEAVDEILDILRKTPDDPDYVETREAMLDRLNVAAR
jgi:hypothetical protein